MASVTFGEKVAAGLVALTVIGIVALTALGSAIPDELKVIIPAGLTYIFGSRTSQPVKA